MLYHKVKIVRDTNTVYNRAMPSWELQVIQFVFDEGNVQPQETFEVVDRAYPSPGVEYDRLTRRYGSDAESGIPHVASVFGVGAAGLRALKAVMDEAKADEDERKQAGTLPKRRLATVPLRLAQADALLA
jgi:hypothetical protein